MSPADSRRIPWFLICLALVLSGGCGALLLGKDVNWDLLNYHYYNPYAFLTKRLDVDIAPAQLQTFLNPLSDIPFYVMSTLFRPSLVGFTLGCVHGLNLVLVLMIFRALFPHDGTRGWYLRAAGCVALAALAPGYIYELGGTMNDNLVSLFVLFPLWLLVRTDSPPCVKTVLLAGFSLGLGVGLKPTIASYAVCATVTLPLLYQSLRDRVRMPLFCALAGAAGGVVTAGFWWWEMGTRYGNPFLPFFNNIIPSPYILQRSFVYMKFVPTLPEMFVWPFILSVYSRRVALSGFVDLRFALCYLLLIVAGSAMIWRRRERLFPSVTRKERFLVLFFVSSFIAWMLWSSIYRFLIPLESLAPLVALLLISRLIEKETLRDRFALGVALLIAITFRPPHLHRVPWSDVYFSLKRPLPAVSERGIVVMMGSGSSPLSYLIPLFPPSLSFVRPVSNLALRDEDLLYKVIQKRIDDAAAAALPLYLLFSPDDRRLDPVKESRRLHLEFERDQCSEIVPDVGSTLLLCPAHRR